MKHILALCLILSISSCQPETHNFHGYIEGEFLFVSPTTGGILKGLFIERGQHIKQGQALFTLDLTELTTERNRAEAALKGATANLDDLLKDQQRPEEIAVLLKQKEQAQVALIYAEKEYNRKKVLVKKDATSKAAFDIAASTYAEAQARLEEVNAQIKAAQLTARVDRIEAAKATVDSAKQELIQIEKKLAEAAPKASDSGTIQDTYFLEGEYIPAGQPVLSILSPENIKVRFFVPQEILPRIPIGQVLTINCDGCKTSFKAKVSYISSQAEYTPPVIYSVESRDKLVFMVEAKLREPDPALRPGLPVDITIEYP